MYLYTLGAVLLGVAFWKRPEAGRLLIAWIFGRESKPAPPPAELKKAEPEEEEDPNLIILYGSQSGTAETLAFELETEARSYSFVPKVVDLEDFDVDDLASTNLVTVLIATHGEGEPTDSSEQFWEWIQSDDREEGLLKDVTFSVFGLGNRQYEFFNAMGRGVDKHMARLGATQLVPLGEGDDDGSLEEDFAEWKTNYWKETREKFSESGDAGGGEVRIKFAPKFECEFLDDPADARVKAAQAMDHPTDTDPSHPAVLVDVLENRELRQDPSEGSTMHMELDAAKLPYVTADNLSIAPRNDYKLVAKIIKRLEADPDRVFYFTSDNANVKNSFSKPTTIRNALLWYSDITNVPRKAFVSALAQYATDDKEEARLLHLTSAEGKTEYQDWMKKGTSTYDILVEYPSINIPIEHFLELSPRLQVREYTISSSSKAQPKRIAITYAVVEKTSETGGAGVCTQYLAPLKADDAKKTPKIACFVKASSFRFPPNITETPIIMIGPGTGVAPMRAFVQAGSHIKSGGGSLPEWHLFFGCRYCAKDFIYKEELEAAEQKDGVLTKLHTAFSREQAEKYYVQDALRDNSTTIWPLVRDKGAYVYVCGATQMGRSVREAFLAMIEKQNEVSAEKAQEVLRNLQESKRFVQELWG